MTATTQARQPGGVPVGGQFATTTRSEAVVALPAAGPHWVVVEREHGAPLAVGPFASEDAAETFMNDSSQVQGIAEEDSLDIYVGSGELHPLVGVVPAQHDGPRVLATIQKQEWVGDTAYPVGDPFQVDVTDLIEELTPESAAKIADNDLGSDDLYRMAMDRGLTEQHDGPFEVQVEASLREYELAVATERLTALAEELEVDPTDLDDAVRDVTDQMASDMVNASDDDDIEDAQDRYYGEMDAHASSVNNDGRAAQVAFLVEHAGEMRTEAILREIAESSARIAALPRRRKPGR